MQLQLEGKQPTRRSWCSRSNVFLGLTFSILVVVNSTYAIIAPFFPLCAPVHVLRVLVTALDRLERSSRPGASSVQPPLLQPSSRSVDWAETRTRPTETERV